MKKILIISLFAFLLACNRPDYKEEERAIKELLKLEQVAHLEKDVDLFVSEFVEGMISVNRGKVSMQTKEEHKARIHDYFNRVEFIKWEDTAKPVIRFSDDASLAYVIIQKQVVVVPREDPASKPDTTDFAWVSVLRKIDGKWKSECNVSTNKITH